MLNEGKGLGLILANKKAPNLQLKPIRAFRDFDERKSHWLHFRWRNTELDTMARWGEGWGGSFQASDWPGLTNEALLLAEADTPHPASVQEYTLDPDTDIKAGRIRIKVKNPNSKESLSSTKRHRLFSLIKSTSMT